MRTVTVNERGQIVIPEDIRIEFGIKEATTLVIMEKDEELVLKREADVLKAFEAEDVFWKALQRSKMEKGWEKEDEIWDKVYKESK